MMAEPLWSYTVDPAPRVARDPLAPGIEEIALRDLALDLSTGDLEVPIRIVKGADAVMQRIWIRFRIWLGAWFLDQRRGVPYLEQILVKNPSIPIVRSILRRVVAETPGVAGVPVFEVTFDERRRTLSPSFEAILSDRSILRVRPFILFRVGETPNG